MRSSYKAKNGEEYMLNFIDTPGHVDFTYEVSRALAACEGALLVIDATQGIEAQTLANVYLALDNDLEIIPVINKVDLPSADPDRVKHEIEEVIGIDASEAVLTSAKTGLGIEDVLEAIVAKVPAPSGISDSPLKALVFDSKFDAYKGVVLYVRVIDGRIKPGMKIKMMATNAEFEVTEVGVFKPNLVNVDSIITDLAVLDIIKTIDQIGDRRLTCSGRSDECNLLSRCHQENNCSCCNHRTCKIIDKSRCKCLLYIRKNDIFHYQKFIRSKIPRCCIKLCTDLQKGGCRSLRCN